MKDKITIGIIGGAGYTGGETIRLLLNHPGVILKFVHSRSNAGNVLSAVHTDLTGDTELKFTDTLQHDVDVIFLCLGHGESKRATNIANPGCFATAIELGLLPLAKLGLLKDVYTTGITGSTGGGQKLQDTTHFTWRANNVSAYKTLTHQHLKEITQSVKHLQHDFSGSISFVPWRGDFTRGIFVSSVMASDKSLDELNTIYKDFYTDHPFTLVSNQTLDLKQVVNTNKCILHLEKEGDKLVIHSAIDNLLKGASGQAVQNMNLMFGFEETEGLKLKAGVF